jgi:hypothetical protein
MPMAGKNASRAKKMVAVAEARTRRASEAVQAAQHALDHAIAMQRQSEAERDDCFRQLFESRQLLAQSPGSDQHRLWIEHCRRVYEESCEAVQGRIVQVKEAESAFEDALATWQRQQLRQEHLTNHAKKLAKAEARSAESKLEDEIQEQTQRSMEAAPFAVIAL